MEVNPKTYCKCPVSLSGIGWINGPHGCVYIVALIGSRHDKKRPSLASVKNLKSYWLNLMLQAKSMGQKAIASQHLGL